MDEEAAFVVEYASNARSKCANKPCSLKIEKGCIRIGRLVANPFHEGDQMTKWYHAECIFIALTRARSTTKKIESIEDLSGRDSLEDEEIDQLEEWIEKYKNLKNVGTNASKKRKKEEKEEVQGEAPKKKAKMDEKKPGGKLKLPASMTKASSSSSSSSSSTSSPKITSPTFVSSPPPISSPPSFQSPPPPKPKPAPKKETKPKPPPKPRAKRPKTETTEPKKKPARKGRKKKEEDPDEYDNSEDDRDLSDGFVVDDGVVEHEDGRFSFREGDDEYEDYSDNYSESDGEYRPRPSSRRGGYDLPDYSDDGSYYSDEDDSYYNSEDDSLDEYAGRRRRRGGGGGRGGGGNESGEWEEIPAHLLQEGNEVDKEEYMRRHPEREVGMSELVGMGFDSSKAWDALETTNDDVQLAIDVLTAE